VIRAHQTSPWKENLCAQVIAYTVHYNVSWASIHSDHSRSADRRTLFAVHYTSSVIGRRRHTSGLDRQCQSLGSTTAPASPDSLV
ncbi:hypothetical protein AcV5_007219, partial [Taiwanofungus camphoratus]